MAFKDITKEQRSSDFTNVTNTSAKLISLKTDGSAVLEIDQGTSEFILQQLSLPNGKPVIISTGSTYFLAGDYESPRLSCSVVRIVEVALDDK